MKKKTKIHKKIMNEQKTFVKVKVKVKKENIIRKSSKPEQTKCSKEESGILEKSNKSKKGVIPDPQRPGRDSDPDPQLRTWIRFFFV